MDLEEAADHQVDDQAASGEILADQEKCIRQHARTAATNAKCHSSHRKANRSTAGIATQSTSQRDSKAISKRYFWNYRQNA